MVNGNPVTGATNNTFTPSGSGKVSCHIKVKAKESNYTILDRVLYSSTVVFVKPEGGNDNNSGLDDQHPVKTWQKAYSLLNEKATWDENTIVLIGRSPMNATGNDGGFSITTNLKGNNLSEDYATWKRLVDASHLAKNVTITGKYNGTDYRAVIEGSRYGGQQYIGLFGDTRFEHITFNHTDSRAGNYGNHSQYIFCQYHNLEMGEGIQMTGYNPAHTPGYGGIDGARIVSMQIYGGFNNDARFHKNNDILYNFDTPSGKNNSLEAMERAMPHGKEGFSITLKSGRYSSVCVGGRQSGSKMNGLMGTPNMPVKCTITLDIDRDWNDAHNEANADYDCGIILAGCQEGAMYADADIIVKSGYVARIVSGTEGNLPKNYQGNIEMPANTYAGRANILIDPRKGNGEIDNKKVIVTELYGGSTGRGYSNGYTIDNPVYGYSTITINGGTFKILPENNTEKDDIFCGIFGAGAGGYNGIGDDSHPTPDKHIAYWGSDRILFGDYATAKNDLVNIKCYNANDNTYTIVDPRLTNTKIVINGGIFGTADNNDFDGIYAGGSGFMSPSLFFETDVVPNVAGGNVYGKTGETVSSLTINGGTFYCKNGIFAGGAWPDIR